MKQVFLIHGGNSFNSDEEYMNYLENQPVNYEMIKSRKSWAQWLGDQLEGTTDVLTPSFPNKQNAQYDEWKVYFEKLLPFFRDDVRLVGHSLGAMFLAKYLHEHTLKQPVTQLVLLAGGYDDPAGEGYGSFAVGSATNLEKSAKEIHLLHSEDDPVVAYSELNKYRRDLPMATVHRFTDKNHFLSETFPELLAILQQK